MAQAAKKLAPTRGVPITDPSFVPEYDDDGIVTNDPDAPITTEEDLRRAVPARHRGRAVSLATLRKGRGLSQVEVAKASAGLDQAHVSKLEREGADMMVSTLRKYVEALGAELELHVVVKGASSWRVKL